MSESGVTLLSPENLLAWPNIAALLAPNPPQTDEGAAFSKLASGRAEARPSR